MATSEASGTRGGRMTTFGQLKVGDTIVCPITGQAERVTRVNHGYGTVRSFVRTSRHDHIRPKAQRVETVRDRRAKQERGTRERSVHCEPDLFGRDIFSRS
jgi:hypothetical protein